MALYFFWSLGSPWGRQPGGVVNYRPRGYPYHESQEVMGECPTSPVCVRPMLRCSAHNSPDIFSRTGPWVPTVLRISAVLLFLPVSLSHSCFSAFWHYLSNKIPTFKSLPEALVWGGTQTKNQLLMYVVQGKKKNETTAVKYLLYTHHCPWPFHMKMMERTWALETNGAMFKPQLYLSLSLWSRYLTSWGFSVLMCKMDITRPTSEASCEDSTANIMDNSINMSFWWII